MNFTTRIFGSLVLTLCVFPLSLHAMVDMYGTELASITVGKDFVAHGSWVASFSWNGSEQYHYVQEFSEYGTAATTKYSMESVYSATQKEVKTVPQGDEVLGIPTDPKGGRNPKFILNYKVIPHFTSPVAIYEFWMPNEVGVQRTIHISFPAEWNVLSTWPQTSSTTNGKITLEYPTGATDGAPVVVLFKTAPLGTVQKFGKFTVAGSAQEVQKIVSAFSKISNVDELLKKHIGTSLPDSVFIVSDDLSKVEAIGFDAEAVAGRPNFIILNNQFTKNESVEEVAETLAHELLHLSMFAQNLFKGRGYIAPFFDEGIAVYFQTIVHRLIYTDSTRKILAEDLMRTKTVSPTGARALYESSFDFNFDGSRPMGTYASYIQSGLLFGRFADKVGVKGFESLWAALRNTNISYSRTANESVLLSHLLNISGLSRYQLLTPGVEEKDIDGIISRISHPENDADKSADVITEYIQNSIPKYFSATGSTPQTTIPTSVVATTIQTKVGTTTAVIKITRTLASGSKGTEVTTLQEFLIAKKFLTMAPSTAKGTFGPATKKALMAYQKARGLKQTGTTDVKTRAILATELE